MSVRATGESYVGDRLTYVRLERCVIVEDIRSESVEKVRIRLMLSKIGMKHSPS